MAPAEERINNIIDDKIAAFKELNNLKDEKIELGIEGINKRIDNIQKILGIIIGIILTVGGGLFGILQFHASDNDSHRSRQEIVLEKEFREQVLHSLDKLENTMNRYKTSEPTGQ